MAQKQNTPSENAALPVTLRNRIILHGETTPYHREKQRELGIEYADLQTWKDLRVAFDQLDDDDLRQIEPESIIPGHYSQDELVPSHSSGTTGAPKTVYWHQTDVEANIESTAARLESADIPENTHWVATATPNPVLKQTLRGLAEHFNGTIDILEVDPTPVKQALQAGESVEETLRPIAQRVCDAFNGKQVGVYEDIAPMMKFVGHMLPRETREQIDSLLVGGVGTTNDLVDELTDQVFPNASLTGWYGDYMNGTSGMHTPESLEYVPQYPDIAFEVRKTENLDTLVSSGEQGELVSHAIRRGFFLPNRRVGDGARPIQINGIDCVTDIHRLEE